MRVLGRIRLSRLSEESTSPERQREVIETWAKQNDHDIASWAIDLDVSGAVDPFDTPSLGPWLTGPKLQEWDILASWRLDRLARRAVPLHRLFGLCQDEGKTLVCVSDNIDLSHWVGRLVASVIAGVAEGELEAYRERASASHQKLRELGRWPGGKPAYGYKAQEREDAAGWELVPDDHSSMVLSSIVGSVLDGRSVESVAKEWTNRGELSPADYIRQRAGELVRSHPWHGTTITKMLKSRTMLGHVTHDGVTVRDAEGVPVRKGPPLISQEQFARLQSVLESRSFEKTNNRTSKASPLLGVVLCSTCESPMHFRGQTQNGKLYRYYYCRTGKHGAQIRADQVEELVKETFLEAVGDKNVQERVFIQAENHQIALAEAVRAVEEITPLLDKMTSDTVRKRLTEQLTALDKRIIELERLPTQESRYEYRETEETYAEAWAEADTDGKRRLLLRSGITAAVGLRGKSRQSPGSLEFELRVPDNVRERLST